MHYGGKVRFLFLYSVKNARKKLRNNFKVLDGQLKQLSMSADLFSTLMLANLYTVLYQTESYTMLYNYNSYDS